VPSGVPIFSPVRDAAVESLKISLAWSDMSGEASANSQPPTLTRMTDSLLRMVRSGRELAVERASLAGCTFGAAMG